MLHTYYLVLIRSTLYRTQMSPLLFKKFWKEILLAALVAVSGYFIYDKIYAYAEHKTAVKYEEKWADYNKALDTRIKTLEDLSQSLYDQNEQKAKKLDVSLAALLLKYKNIQLYTITNDGKCVPSKEFLDSYNAIITGSETK